MGELVISNIALTPRDCELFVIAVIELSGTAPSHTVSWKPLANNLAGTHATS